jgi:aminopeptidase
MYTPSKKDLHNYARIMVRFALNSGKGIKPGEVVYLAVQQPGLPLAKAIYSEILQAGGHPLLNIIDDEFKLLHLQNASDEQLTYFPKQYYKGLADNIDHWVRILAENDPMYLKKVDARKVILANKAAKPFREWLDKKEDQGEFTWTLCMYGTEGAAREAGLSEKQYWQQIRQACFLNTPDPLATWKQVFGELQLTLDKINKLKIDKLHVEAEGTDLWITLGEQRRWLGGSGRNIPSFEIFTSPDWRGTEGHIFFDLPLYRYGNIIKDIRLEFKQGRIVKATAGKNQALLREMIAQPNADKIGEFSLTDKRFSKITKFMANTLFDENFGGRFGNTHLAVGKSYHDTFTGDAHKATKAQFEKLGFNDSIEHTDIIATTSRTVTATMTNGSTRVIYKDGEFSL